MFRYPFTVKLNRGFAAPDGIHLQRVWDEFVFELRGITRQEWADWQVATPSAQALEDRLLQEAVLTHPATCRGEAWDWDRVYAGVAQQVIDKVLSLSGLSAAPDPDVMGPAESYLAGDAARFDLLVLSAFPYKLEELLSLDPQTYHQLVGLAARKLAMLGLAEQVESLLDPEAAKKRKPTLSMPTGQMVPGQPGPGGGRAGVQRSMQNEGALLFTSDGGRPTMGPHP